LILVDIAQATDRRDLLSEFSQKRITAESWVLNCLMFGLNNKYTLYRQSNDPHAPSNTVPLIAIDPYPHHVVAAVKLMQNSIERDYETGKLSNDTYQNLISTLTETLSQLPQGSKSVQIAKASVSQPVVHQTNDAP